MPRAAYLAIRDLETDPERADGRPALPGAWGCSALKTTPAPTWIARPPSAPPVLIVRCNAVGGRGLYLLRGDRAWLDGLPADEVMPGREAWRRGREAAGTPRLMLRGWRWWRCDVTERATQEDVDAGDAVEVGDPIQRDRVTRELSAEGVLLPAGMVTDTGGPWDLDAAGNATTVGAAVTRVRALRRPVLAPGGTAWTMAGSADHRAAEAESDRAAGV